MENFTPSSNDIKRKELKTLLEAIEKVGNEMIEQNPSVYVTELVFNLAMDAYEVDMYKALNARFLGNQAEIVPFKPKE